MLVSSIVSFVTLAGTAAAVPYRGQKAPISEELFQVFKRFTEYASASTYQPCAVPPHGAQAVAYINNSLYDTQASVFRDDTRRQFILAMPGSATKEDYRIDAEAEQVPYVSPGVSCEACYVHHGFLKAWNSIAPKAEAILKQNLEMYPHHKVFITGHSLGAALAQLAYASLKGQKFPVVAAYTMGQPRVGNPAFAHYIDGLSGASTRHAGDYHRITHAADYIPQIPQEKYGWRHPGTEFWESGINHTSASTTFRCLGDDPADCSKSAANTRLALKDDDHMFYSNIYISDPSTCGY